MELGGLLDQICCILSSGQYFPFNNLDNEAVNAVTKFVMTQNEEEEGSETL